MLDFCVVEGCVLEVWVFYERCYVVLFEMFGVLFLVLDFDYLELWVDVFLLIEVEVGDIIGREFGFSVFLSWLVEYGCIVFLDKFGVVWM